MKKLLILLATFAMLCAVGCEEQGSDGVNPNDDHASSYKVNGSVQKGPFVQGSEIVIQPLDNKFSQTGDSYITKTNDDAGNFSLNHSINRKFVEIFASGYYYDETIGKISSSPLSLRSISSVEKGVANVNLLTTLIYDRIKYLVSNAKTSIDVARDQAEGELMTVLGYPKQSTTFDQFDITKPNDRDALLLAISIHFQYGRSVGELSEFIAKFADDFAVDGAVSSEVISQLYFQEITEDIVAQISENLNSRYGELGTDVSIPNFNKYIKENKDLELQEDNVAVDPWGGFFAVYLAKGASGYCEVKIKSDTNAEHNSAEWVLTDGLYYGCEEIRFFVDPYLEQTETASTRECTLIVEKTTKEGEILRDSCTISQEPLYVPKQIKINSEGGRQSYEVMPYVGFHGIECSLTTEDPTVENWLTACIDQYIYDSSVVVNFESSTNTGAEKRSGYVLLSLKSYSGKEFSFRIEVSQNVYRYIAPSFSTVTVNGLKGVLEIPYQANVGVSIEVHPQTSWISVVSHNNNVVTLSIDANDSPDSRTGYISLTGVGDDGEPINSKITVKQSGFYGEGFYEVEDNTINYVSIIKIIPNSNADFGANIVSHEFENGIGTIIFDGPICQIGEDAFDGQKGLLDIALPSSITKIRKCAFNECTGLESISIPDSVTTIEALAFGGCTKLTSVRLPISLSSIAGGADWNKANGAFGGCTGLTSVLLPEGIKVVGGFDWCTGLTEINIPQGVTKIVGGAFWNCSNLKKISLPESVTEIGGNSFGYCDSLTQIEVPSGVTKLGWRSFICCKNLKNVILHEGLIEIAGNAFYQCHSLTTINIPESVTTIGELAFYSCGGLTSVHIPKNVNFIDRNAFCECVNLQEVYCHSEMPPTLGEDNFKYCRHLQKIYVPSASVDYYKILWSDYANLIFGYDF